MREIKFRAWDTKYNQWDYFSLGHLVSRDNLDIAEECINWSQYTGLKDKNGVEIYEGDVVQPIDRQTLKTSPARVICWNSGTARYNGLTLGDTRDMLVIGNIYENPELLKA